MDQLPAILPSHHYQILMFSMGQLLKDDCSLAWYRLCPHELLKLHPLGTIVHFPHDVMLEYIKPYLELNMRALCVVVNDKDMHVFGPAYATPDAPSPSKNKKLKDLAPDGPSVAGNALPASQSTRKHRKTKMEWRDQCLFICQGMLSLFKSRTVSSPQKAPLGPSFQNCPDLTMAHGKYRILRQFRHARSRSSLPCHVPGPCKLKRINSSKLSQQAHPPYHLILNFLKRDLIRAGRPPSERHFTRCKHGPSFCRFARAPHSAERAAVPEHRHHDEHGQRGRCCAHPLAHDGRWASRARRCACDGGPQ